MKLHELKIKHEYLVDITLGLKTFEIRKNDRDYQVGDLIRFIDIGVVGTIYVYHTKINSNTSNGCDVDIDEDALYKIIYILKDVPQYGLDKDYCILGIKKLNIKE